MARTTRPTEAAQLRGPLNGLIAERMRKLRLNSVKDFAEYAGVGRTSIHDLVRGRSTANGTWTKPSLETLTKLASALEKPAHELMYMIDPEIYGADLLPAVQQLSVYVAGRVGAGPEQLDPLADEEVFVENSFAEGRDLVAYRVRGESMAGGRHPIYNDDVVIVDRNTEGQINMPVVARLREDGYVVKRLRAGGSLDSTNADYDDPNLSVISPDRVAQIVGRVVRIVSNNVS